MNKQMKDAQTRHVHDQLDESLANTFPASDPIAAFSTDSKQKEPPIELPEQEPQEVPMNNPENLLENTFQRKKIDPIDEG